MQMLNFKINTRNDLLKFAELTFLSLMLISLPSIEAPKNIFLILFLLTSIYRQIIQKNKTPWKLWDWIFLSYIGSSFFSAIFAGITPGNEWHGFRSFLIWTGFAWLLSRIKYQEKEIVWILCITILGVLPPLLYGLIQFLFLHTKEHLELHSVGHVNHSAIYLGIIAGAGLSLTLTIWEKIKTVTKIFFVFLNFIFLTSIALTVSRGAFGIVICLFPVLILLSNISYRKKLLIVISIIIFIGILIFNNAEIVEEQTNTIKINNNLSGRPLIWNVSIEAAHMHPLFGVGNGNWKLIKMIDIENSNKNRGVFFDPSKFQLKSNHSHSLYLTSLSERGIVGLIILINFMLAWFLLLVKSYKKLKTLPTGFAIWGGSLSAWATTFGIGFVNSTLHHEHAILALLFLGLHLGFLKESTKK